MDEFLFGATPAAAAFVRDRGHQIPAYVQEVTPQQFGRQRYYLMCAPVDEMRDPVPGSRIRRCKACRCRVWYHPQSTMWKPGETILCTPCVLALGQKGE